MGFSGQCFHYLLPSKLHGSGFYHDGTLTRKNALPFAGHAIIQGLTPSFRNIALREEIQKSLFQEIVFGSMKNSDSQSDFEEYLQKMTMISNQMLTI
jgi:hypothetical protein